MSHVSGTGKPQHDVGGALVLPTLTAALERRHSPPSGPTLSMLLCPDGRVNVTYLFLFPIFNPPTF